MNLVVVRGLRHLALAASILLTLASPSFGQARILSGTFEGDGGSLSAFVTADGQRQALAAPSTWGAGMKLAPDLLKALSGFKAQVLFERRPEGLVPIRLHSPQPYEGWIHVEAADEVTVNGFEAKPVGTFWQHLWADELKDRELRVVGLFGSAKADGGRQLHVLKVEATIKAATATLRRTDSEGARQTWLLTFGRRVWLQLPKSGRSELEPDGAPVLAVTDEETPADQVSARPWGARVTDLRIGQPVTVARSAGLTGSVPR